MTEQTSERADKKPANKELAELITAQLVEAGLVLTEKSDELLLKLENGKVTEQDWQLYLEQPILKKEHQEAKNATC